MKIEEVMSFEPACGTPQTSLREIAQMMVDCDCGMIPIVEQGQADSVERRAVGVVTDRDIVCRAIAKDQNPLDLVANDVMTKNVISCTPEADIEDALELMKQKHVRRLLVLEDDGTLCGILSQADIVRVADRSKAGEMIKEISRPEDEASAPAPG